MVSTIAEYVHPHTYVERNASAAHVSRRRYVVPLPVVNPVARTITTTPSSTSSDFDFDFDLHFDFDF